MAGDCQHEDGGEGGGVRVGGMRKGGKWGEAFKMGMSGCVRRDHPLHYRMVRVHGDVWEVWEWWGTDVRGSDRKVSITVTLLSTEIHLSFMTQSEVIDFLLCGWIGGSLICVSDLYRSLQIYFCFIYCSDIKYLNKMLGFEMFSGKSNLIYYKIQESYRIVLERKAKFELPLHIFLLFLLCVPWQIHSSF